MQRPRTRANYLKKVLVGVNGLQLLAEGEVATPTVCGRFGPYPGMTMTAGKLARHDPGGSLTARAIEPPFAGRTPRLSRPLSLEIGFRPGHAPPFIHR